MGDFVYNAPMTRRFADLHCHPALFGFNRLRHGKADGDADQFHAWNIPDDIDHRSMGEGKRAATYTQCTMPMLAASKTRLAFASITPIEKGFFVGAHDPSQEPRFEVEVLRFMTGASFVSTTRHLIAGRTNDAAVELTRILRNRGPLRRALQRAFLRYNDRRVRFMQSNEYDYFEELIREYEFYANADGMRGRAVLHTPAGPDREIEGAYQLARSADHLREVVEETDDTAVVLSIEGAHAFSIQPNGGLRSREHLHEHMEILRDLPHPILFVTLAHHFDNGLCGHAHSLPDAAHWVMDQSDRMGVGFSDVGRWVTRELLDLDDDLRPRGGRRMLIDCKHMSPLSRAQYYAEIVRPHNEWARREEAPLIPVIASHSAYSGVATLEELQKNAAREDDNWHRNPYLAWGINHSDEDVRAVWESRGLIGMCFDQRICGVPPRQTVPREAWIDIMLRQILGTVDAILLDESAPFDERLRIWDCICIGSDFDGLIDPLTAYPTVLEFPQFAEDLAERLDDVRQTRGIGTVGVENLVDKICWKNAYDFALRTLSNQ